MPEVMRFIASRLRHFVADRRSARRYSAELPCTVGLTSDFVGSASARRDASLEGLTCDVSATGLGLVMPAIHIGGRYLTGAGGTLIVLLELPDGPILFKAAAVRYERLEHNESQTKYHIGLHIVEMNQAERVRFVSYLKKL